MIKKRKLGSDDKKKVVNNKQYKEFKMKEGETRKEKFCGKCSKERPAWDDKNRMCACFHINGDCFEECQNASSHVPENKIPQKRKMNL
eukprot:2979504-Ditylum_brightwellii.AAC.2